MNEHDETTPAKSRGVLAGLRRPADVRMGEAKAGAGAPDDLAVLANPDQIALCGVPGWCDPRPRALLWHLAGDVILIENADAAPGDPPLGQAPLESLDLFQDLEKLADAAEIHLLSFDELTIDQHGSVGIRQRV